jgi:hypothetical protein
MSKLLVFTIGGQRIGLDIKTWNEALLSGNTAFMAIADTGSTPANYVNISSVDNWDSFGSAAGLTPVQIKSEIIKLIPSAPTQEQYNILAGYMNVGINSMTKLGGNTMLGTAITGTTVLTGVTDNNIYGTQFHKFTSTGTIANSATVSTPVMTGRTNSLPKGTYKFMVTYVWSRSSQNNFGNQSFSIDGTLQGTRSTMNIRTPNTADIYAEVRTYYATFATAATHTFSFNVWNNAGTTTLSDIAVEIIKVL